MSSSMRIWFSEKDPIGRRSFRRYPVSDLKTAKAVLTITISEVELLKEIFPNMFGLEVWNEDEQDWLEWENEAGMDVREYIFEGNSE